MKKVLLFLFVLLSAQAFPQQCTPSVSIQVMNGPICLSPASFNYNSNFYNFVATPLNGGNSPTYEWQKNGVIYNGITGPFCSVKATTMTDGDIFKCTMTSNAACANPTIAVGNYKLTYTRAILPTTITVSPSNAIYAGTTVEFFW